MASTRTAKTITTAGANSLPSNEFGAQQPLVVTLRPIIAEALPRLRRLGALSDASLSEPQSPLAPLGARGRSRPLPHAGTRSCPSGEGGPCLAARRLLSTDVDHPGFCPGHVNPL
jgi:hypothetical protein